MTRSTFWPDMHQTVLLHAILDRPEQARAAAARWLRSVDFEAIDAGSQRLLPLLHSRLQSLGIDHPLAPRIRGVFRRSWYMDQRLRRQLRTVRAAFRDANIDYILFKGAALGPMIYGHGAHRPADDIDILVRPEAFGRAEAVLLQAGWRRDAAQRHASTFGSAIGSVDLHVSPFHEAVETVAIEPLWNARREAMIDGAPADVLSPHDQLLHTLTHGLRANPMPPVRWIVDAVLMIRRDHDQLDWDRFLHRARQLGYTLVAGRGLRYLVNEFGVSVPDSVIERLDAQPRSLAERLEYRCGRHDRFQPVAKLVLSYRQGRRGSFLGRCSAVAREYRDFWRSPSTGSFLVRVIVRLALGRRLTARIYPRSAR